MRRRTVALLAVAMLLAACSGGPGGAGGPAETTMPPVTVPAPPPEDGVHYRWETGDCLAAGDADDLPYEPFGAAPVVGCEEPHTYEVYFTADLEEGEDDPYPAELGLETFEACAAAFDDYVGVHQSQSSLDVVLYLPDAREWEEGLRYRACLVFRPGDGRPEQTTGSLRGAGEAVRRVPAAGECFAGRSARGEPADCGHPHAAEVVGSFTHPDGEWPGAGEAASRGEAGCAAVLEEYSTPGSPVVPASPIAYPRRLSEAEWEDGVRTVACTALVFDAGGDHLQVVGSLADPDWWVIGSGTAA